MKRIASPMATCLSRLASHRLLLLLALGMVAGQPDKAGPSAWQVWPNPHADADPEDGTGELQAINWCLSAWRPASLDSSTIVPLLWDLFERSSNCDQVAANLLSKYDQQRVRSILTSLISASGSCDHPQVDFLELVIQRGTHEGQLLNEYSRKLMDSCWWYYIDQLVLGLKRSTGKMNMHLFELAIDVANRLVNLRKGLRSSLSGQINIRDQEPSRDRAQVARSLHDLALDDDYQLSAFGRALNDALMEARRADSDQSGLDTAQKPEVEPDLGERTLDKLQEVYLDSMIIPCGELVARAGETRNFLGFDFDKHSQGMSTRDALDEKRIDDVELDILLEMYRICRQVRENELNIWNVVKRVHGS